MSIYHKFGVEPVINASGAVTRLGGSPMPPEVLEAFTAAAGEAVSLEQLQAAASREISAVTKTEAALVTAGCAAALTMGTAAILAGQHLGRMERLPHSEGFPNEMVIAREQRSGYDHAVRAAGARLVEVGFNEIVANAGVRRTEAWEYEAAFGPQTAGVIYTFAPHSRPALAEVVAVAHKHGLPVLVDAAGELPPRDNLHRIPATGADLVAFSGGKSICGPQSTGILCGKRELISSAALQMLDMDDHWELWDPPADWIDKRGMSGMPRHGLGRALKVSKEEIVALLTALRLFNSGAYAARLLEMRKIVETIITGLADSPVTCVVEEPLDSETPPTLQICAPATLKQSAWEICRALRNGTPPIYVSHSRLAQGVLLIRPSCLKPEHAEPIVRRIREEAV